MVAEITAVLTAAGPDLLITLADSLDTLLCTEGLLSP